MIRRREKKKQQQQQHHHQVEKVLEKPSVTFEDVDEEEDEEDVVSDLEVGEEDLLEDEDLEAEIAQDRAILSSEKTKEVQEDGIIETTLLEKLDEIKLRYPDGKPVAWSETLDITIPRAVNVEDPNDDLTREMEFYRLALEASTIGYQNLKQNGIKYKRPKDFYAEMMKDDSHMTRIKEVLLAEKKRIESIEERKKQRDQKKYGKQLQLKQKLDKARQKKEDMEAITKWRRARKKGQVDAELPLDLEGPSKKRKAEGENGDARAKKMTRREQKEQKYKPWSGKKGDKRNTRESLDDFGEGKKRKEGQGKSTNHRGGRAASGRKPKNAKKRPGKMARKMGKK